MDDDPDIDKFRRRLKFRTMLLCIAKDISNQQCKDLSFLYELGPYKGSSSFVDPLELFNELVRKKCVEDKEELLKLLQTSLNNIGCTHLSKFVSEFMKKENFTHQGPIEESSRIATSYDRRKIQLGFPPPHAQGKGTVVMEGYDDDNQPETTESQPEPTTVTDCQEDYNNTQEDEKHMKSAEKIAQDSSDPDTKVGAVIVGAGGDVIAKGYNCMPPDCEGKLPWTRIGQSETDTKYPYVVHAIENAIMSALMNGQCQSLRGSTVYTTLFPGHQDAKMMVQCGIKRLLYLDDKYMQKNFAKAAIKLFDTAEIQYTRCVPGQ